MRDDARVDSIVADWLARRSRGDAVAPGALIRDHPDLATQLERRFAALNLLDLAFAAAAETPAIPDQIGPFGLDELLGAGGMGTVYRAHVVERSPGFAEGQVVALKVVHPHLLSSAGFFQRFLREAELGRRVAHENVVRTLGVDAREQDGHHYHYLVMEHVEGQTLRELAEELDTVPEELLRHVGREVARGLAAIHAAGVVHRDVKPENLLITNDHVVKVMDLGVARLADQSLRLSLSGAFVGSVEYAAPEQFGAGDVDARADLHALGVVLYELATGTHPYRDDDFRSVMRRILDEAPRRAGELNPQLSPFFEEVVHGLLAKRPDERFADAATLLTVLDEGEDAEWWRDRAQAIRTATKRPLRRIRIPRETAVYGREDELARLTSLFEAARSGDGQVVLLEGEAGIGKSRLVDELIARLQHDGEDLDFLFGSYPPGGAATAAGAFSTAYREQFGEEGSLPWLPQSPSLAPAFDALLNGEAAPSGAEPLTKDSLQTCFVQVTRALAAERPTVVLIDDLHFAPEEGRALFASLALAVPSHRILLLGTVRPGVPSDWLAALTRREQTSRVEIGRLGPKDLSELLRDSFRSEQLAEQLSFKISTKSDGNPFFAFEIIRGLREGQFITQRGDGTWIRTRAIDDIQIPSSVLDLVNARVAGLTEDERALLDVAACWGYEFDPGLVGDVLGLARVPTLRAFGQMERQHRLVRAAGRTMVFDHHQVQEALYGSLLEQLREEYHAALAAALESRTRAAERDPDTLDGALCVDLCDHYLKGARGDAAVRYLAAAHTHLENGYLHAQVVALTERALAEPGLLTGMERAKALLRLSGAGGPLDHLAHHARREQCAREAERLAEAVGDDELRARAANALGLSLHYLSREAEAEVAFRRVLGLARSLGDKRLEAHATMNLGLVFGCQSRPPEEQAQHERALALYREIGNRRGEAWAMNNLGRVFGFLGRVRAAQEHAERSLAISREIGNRRGEASATGRLASALQVQGRLVEAAELLARQLALYREIGDRLGVAAASTDLGWVLHAQGRVREAQEFHERCLALAREMGNKDAEAAALGNLGAVFTSLGRLSEAQEHHERALALRREDGDAVREASSLGNLGAVLCSEGRLAEGRTQLERSLALCREFGNARGEVIALHNLGELHREEGDVAKGEARYEACIALCEETGLRHLQAVTQYSLGALRAAASWGARGRELLTAARDAGQAGGFPDLEVLARCELAALPGGDAEDALAAVAAHEERLSAVQRREARLLLFKATRDQTHLTEAKRLLDEHVAMNPPEYHDAMCRNVRVNREILAAWREEFGEDDNGSVGDSPAESPTRAG